MIPDEEPETLIPPIVHVPRQARPPKKVRLGNTTERFPKSRRQLMKEADQEMWNKLHKIGLTSSGSVVSTGSAAIDQRLKTNIGMPKGDPTVGQWHGSTHGAINYQGTEVIVTQWKRQVWKNRPEGTPAFVCRIWVDDTVTTKEKETEIAKLFGGDFLVKPSLVDERIRKHERPMHDITTVADPE